MMKKANLLTTGLIVAVWVSIAVAGTCNREDTTQKHECGKGPVVITTRYEKQQPDSKPADCKVNASPLARVSGSTYKVPPTTGDFMLSNTYMVYNERRWYTRDCEQDYMYTDWPECGGERMYPSSTPRDVKCACAPDCECQ